MMSLSMVGGSCVDWRGRTWVRRFVFFAAFLNAGKGLLAGRCDCVMLRDDFGQQNISKRHPSKSIVLNSINIILV